MNALLASRALPHSFCLQSKAVLVMLALLLALPPGGDVAEAGLPTGWVCFDGIATTPVPPRVGIVSSGSDELVLDIEVPGVLSTDVKEGEIDFRKLEFPGYYRSTEVGHPALPAVRQLIAVPAGCTVGVSVSTPDSIRYWDSVVYPVPALVTRYTEDGWEYLAEEFSYDEEAYSAKGYYPTQTASVGSVGILRGQGVALLTVYPIQFDASSELIRVLPLVTVTLTFTGGYGGVSGDLGPFDSIAEGVLLNYDGYGARGGRAQADTGKYRRCESVAACDSVQADYLMIVQDSLYASPWVDTLAAHRANYNCYNVAIVSDDALGAQISDTAIKQFIEEVYDTESSEHMSDGHLGYVLLVGDARDEEPYGYMPAHEQNTITTDHWYACVDGDDDRADLMIGRLCASDTLELQTEVEKFVAYERNATSTQPSWRDTVLLSCGFAWIGDDCNPADLNRAVTTDAAFDSVGVLVQGRYTVQEVHAHEQGPAANCFEQYDLARPLNVQFVNEGCHIAEFCSHGGPNGMPVFWPEDVSQLDNGNELPFWMSYACWTGAYDRYHNGSRDCLGEKLLHPEESGGAIGYFGSTELSAATTATFLGMYVWEGILNDHHYEIGQFLTYAKLKHFSRTGDPTEVLKYNLLGDPALNLELTDHHGYGSAPDYVVTSSDLLILPMFPSYYDTVHLSAVIHNISNYDPDPGDSVAVVFTVSERDGSDAVFVETTYVDPPAWSTRTAHVVWTQPGNSGIGEWLFTVEIDTSGVELFKDNNSAQGPLCIYFERPGFDPYNLHASGAISPTIADINGEAGVEVVVAASDPGRVVALSSDGHFLWAFPVPEGLSIRGPASVGDLDFDGDREVIVCYGDSVLALSGVDGRRAWTQPCRVRGLKSGATLADLEAGDGRLEVVTEGYKNPMHLSDSHTVTVAAHDGTDPWEYVAQPGAQLDFPTTCPAVADLDGDGESEVVSSFLTEEGPHVVALSGRSGVVDWIAELGGALQSKAPCSPVIADVDRESDGLEVLCGTGTLCCLDAGGTQLWSTPLPGAAAGCAVADVVGSAAPEIVVTVYATADSTTTPCRGWLFVLDASGGVVDSTTVDYRCQNQPVIADLNGDSRWEIIVTSSCRSWEGPTWTHESHLEIFTYDPGSGLGDFLDLPRPLFFRGRIASAPSAADTDSNGCPEIWLVDAEGYVHCLEWPGVSGRLSRWSSFQHDERHTGTYETPVSGAYPESTAVSWWGDYLMTGDVLIHGTSSLVVQPGTTMRATASSDTNLGVDPEQNELIVEGELLATGDGLRPTRFILEEGAQGETRWRGIRLRPPGSIGKLYGCTIDQAFIGIDASNPDMLIAEGCTISRSGVKGISCWGSSGASSILLSGNTVTSAQIGMELHGCRATVESNAITDCQSYGMKIYQDYGSSVHSNTLGESHYAWGPFSGIYVQGSRDTLAISANQIADIKTTGIHYEMPVGEDQAEISGNVITGTGVCTKGMYFYESGPLVRENTITDMNTGFWIQTQGVSPDLGDAEVSDGGNCVQGQVIQYYVRVVGSVQDSVKAECNYWWSKTGKPDSSKFSSWVDWDLWLDDCPNGRSPGQEDGDTDARLVFSLNQNHPNPFNPNTRIQFSVPRRTRVQLRIYDLAGRLVRTLDDREREPGLHEVVWDGRDTRGVRVASGVYFCRLEAGGSVDAKKLVLLK